MNIGQLTIYTEGKTDVVGIVGKEERVYDAWTEEGIANVKKYQLPVGKERDIVSTTKKDFEVKEYRNCQKLNITQDMWDYYSSVKKKNKKYIENLPSRTSMNQYKVSTGKFIKGVGKGFDFSGVESIMQFTHDVDAAARFIIFIEDMVSTILSKSDVERSDYKIEFFDLNS